MLVVCLQGALSGGMLLLLAGHAGRLRIAAGAAAFAFFVGTSVATVVALSGGPYLIAAAMIASKGDLSPAEGLLKGEAYDYCVDLPPRWYVNGRRVATRESAGREDAARQQNARADRRLVRPDLDAHAMILVDEAGPGRTFVQSKFEQAVLADLKERLKEIHLAGTEAIPRGKVIDATWKLNGVDLEQVLGVFAEGNRAYQVLVLAPQRAFAGHREELVGIVRSFRTGCVRVP